MSRTAAPCPYGSLNASRIVVTGPLCQSDANATCVVDTKCKVLERDISGNDANGNITLTVINGYMTGWDSVDALGDLSNLPTIGFSAANFTSLNLDALVFSKDMEFFSIDNASVPVIPRTLVYPGRLAHLNLIETNTANIPDKFPERCFDFGFLYQPLNTSTLVNIPPSVQFLDLHGNGITNLTHLKLDWTNKTHVYVEPPMVAAIMDSPRFLHKNKIQAISNVTFKKGKLKAFYLSNANISHFELDPDSFEAINVLSPAQKVAQAMFESQEYGFKLDKYNITQDVDKCTAANGVVTELWAMHSEITKAKYTVCVVAPPTTAVPAPTTADSNTGWIVGVVVGVLVVLGAAFFFIRRRNRKPDDDAEFEYHRDGGKTAGGTTGTRFITDNTATGIDMSELTLYRLNQQDVIPEKKLASGAYADVLYGMYKGTPVAIKKLLSSRVGVNEVQGLIDEIKLLASFTSPYIIKLIGCCWDQPSDLECVLEYMNAGDLRDNLTARTSFDFPWNEKTQVIAAVVDGLAYLHSLPVIHRDLKSRNVLMDTVKPAKLTDFGVSKEDTQETMTVGVGTYRWMAPEILQFNHYSVAADIFSFGMVLSELDSHKIPLSWTRPS
ncbi:TKL protein kinase [Aphanomyces invadans]|uniref:TKL protein kinase n=1 Tax=Aphanomyces invadans TaxID=157072 RepID=A0A024TDC2_9STRA|nr:TKL protein kinase [Aphanomyces invadans]ETV92048.1 TKL protein kinase [Aphanomyces invadans]|eukprot:XP_008879345.1 TKL protein kinase [Aphanomyces invadans]